MVPVLIIVRLPPHNQWPNGQLGWRGNLVLGAQAAFYCRRRVLALTSKRGVYGELNVVFGPDSFTVFVCLWRILPETKEKLRGLSWNVCIVVHSVKLSSSDRANEC